MEKLSWVEQLNSVTRSGVLIILVVPFSVAFAYGVWARVRYGSPLVVSTGEYIGTMSLALTWFFKSRDEKAAAQQAATVAAAVVAPPPRGRDREMG